MPINLYDMVDNSRKGGVVSGKVKHHQLQGTWHLDGVLCSFYHAVTQSVADAEASFHQLAELWRQGRINAELYMVHLQRLYHMCLFKNQVVFAIPAELQVPKATLYHKLGEMFQEVWPNTMATNDVLPLDAQMGALNSANNSSIAT
ncbi:MAG: hypothetical protein JJT82_03805 [Legionellaceae bacterium]|nr:hypothetical protein [Legionellaceae bacterium]